MLSAEIQVKVPEALVDDFASDPLSSYEKVLRRSCDPSWPLYSQLSNFLAELPSIAVEVVYQDPTFTGLYGKNERLARVRIAERLLVEAASRARLQSLAETRPKSDVMPYSTDCLRGLDVNEECMVKLADFEYNGSTLLKNRFSFTVCSTNANPNSTYWLLRSFYDQDISQFIGVRLDPFLWGPSDSFPQMTYKMIVYAKPLNWDGIGRLREQLHGEMRADKPWDRSEVTQYCWDPRDDGVHFICEEVPAEQRIGFEGSRYLHAIYNPGHQSITHLDGALRIYTAEEFRQRHESHLRKSGKIGVRRKIFRIDESINRDTFSLIAQAFFVWNDELAKYFRETLHSNP